MRIAGETSRVGRFRKYVLKWFEHGGRQFPWRRASARPYARVVSEVLLQRTRAETVAKFMPSFLKQFPSWRHLDLASVFRMQASLRPIGLWRRRAEVLRALGHEMKNRHGRFPRRRIEIERLPGVGQYVASAVMLFYHGGREPLLDVNMARVLERCFGPRHLADIRYDPWLQRISREVVRHRQAISINWAVLDIAAAICTIRNPNCEVCPVRTLCRYARARTRRGAVAPTKAPAEFVASQRSKRASSTRFAPYPRP